MAVLADPARSEALLVGVHTYTTLDDLPAVARNLDGLGKVLTDPAVWGLRADRCTVLSQPHSAQEVLDTVQETARRAQDTLFVYYAGHGLTDPHTDELYLALPDSDREREYTALRYEYLRRAVLDPRVGARRTVVVLDCCYSGRALVGRMSASDYIADHAMVEGTCLLTASAETRTALSPPGETYTAFTGELITALANGIPGAPDPIDMNTLYWHLHRTLAAQSRPLPQQRNRNTGGLIALARNRATTLPASPTPSQQPAPTLQPSTPSLGPDLAPAPTPNRTNQDPGSDTAELGPHADPGPPRRWRRRINQPVVGETVPLGSLQSPLRRLVNNRVMLPLGVFGVVGVIWLGIALNTGGGDGNTSRSPTHQGRTGRTALSTGGDSNTIVTLGVDAPLTGELSALGIGIKNSVDLAVKQANKDKVVDGVTFKIKALDDQAVPSSGQQNATKLVANKSVFGVVGPLNSSVAQSMRKVFNDANLAVVSPANTVPDMTQGEDWQSGKKVRPFRSYYRTVTTDAIQGPFAAQYLYNDAKKRKVFLIDDQETYGAGLAGTFKTEFVKLGGKVVGTEHVNPDAKDFSAVATKVKNSGADVVYYGGAYPAAGPLSAQLKQSGADIPLTGGDGIYSDEFIKLAGKGGQGDFATSVDTPIEELASAKAFVKNYVDAGYKDDYEAYGGYSYDAAWAIIQAVKKVVEDNGGNLPEDARAKVVDALQNVSFYGVTGKVSFDEYGDTTNKLLTVYTVKSGAWIPVKSSIYSG